MTARSAISNSVQSRVGDRFHPKNATDLIAELLILQDDEVIRHSCQMSDISVGGCAVKVSIANPELLSVAVLRIRDAKGNIDVETAGRLCWNQQTSVASNTFGFRFRRPMDIGVIDRIVAAGLVTRRQVARTSADTAVQIRRAHGEPVVRVARLVDFSTTGVRICVDRELAVGERLLITTASGASGSVFAKWIERHENVYECGCVFQNLNSARAIHDALATND